MDPHAWAKVRTRESLEALEQLANLIGATNAEVSRAMLLEVARLKHRLEWCDTCYSRARSIKLWCWVVRCMAELLIKWLGTSRCTVLAVLTAPRFSYDSWNDHQTSATGETPVAAGPREASQHLRILPFAA